MEYNSQKIINQIEQGLAGFVEENFGIKSKTINWETPPELEMGDLAFSCFELARELHQNPVEIAEKIASEFEIKELVSSIENVGPYVNLYFEKEKFCKELISDIIDSSSDYGRGDKKKEKVMLEGFGQLNTHKAVHIGHLRNIFISESVANLFEFSGYKIIRANYQGDIGTHVATCVQQMIDKKIAVESDGAIIVDLEKYNLGVLLVLKSDGTSLYSTKDIALAELKFKKHKIDKSIYVTDVRQRLYFKQIFKTLELMGFTQASKCYHLPYGIVKLKEGIMASRKGNVILAQELYDQILEKVKFEIEKRENVDIKNVDDVANKITLGALKFGMLKYTSESNITFNWQEALKFEGDTGPYLQYAYARINNIKEKSFKKEKIRLGKINFSTLTRSEEWGVVRALAEFPKVIARSTTTYNPAWLISYLLNLSASFNKFYASCPVAKAESEDLKFARFALAESVGIVLKNGLTLLGIEVVERM